MASIRPLPQFSNLNTSESLSLKGKTIARKIKLRAPIKVKGSTYDVETCFSSGSIAKGRGTIIHLFKPLVFSIDCGKPAENAIFASADLEHFIRSKIRFNGQPGHIAHRITITRKDNKIQIATTVLISKRYFKFLIKKFLKKHQLRDWLKVVASGKLSYDIRYFNINDVE